MKHLKKFNEGWKENTLVGLLSLFGVAGMSQNKHKDIRTYHTKSEQTAKSMIRNSWSLDSTQVDTLWKEVQVSKPDTMVMVDRLSLDKDQYFASGKFELLQEVKDSIQITLDEIINKGGIITEVRVESSTDKQGLSSRLQAQLKSIGYSGDNKGLSQARSEAVTNYLVELGVNKTLIDINQKYEIGQETIQQSARYVNVDISYIIINKEVAPSKSIDQPEVKTTYWLSKEKTKSHYHRKHRSKHFEIGSIKILKGRKSAIDACPFFQK